jgi:2-oxoglutarate dehydrogenase E2 component (dihydrolipoamide succinyltransferase)
MAIEIKVPAVGESVTEGILTRWLKKDGDHVQSDEPLFELETDKATAEVPSPGAGALRITVPAGQTIAIGAVVGRIDESATAPKRDNPAIQSAPAPAPARAADGQAIKESAVLSPAARRVADDAGIEHQSLQGTGKGGHVSKEDVVRRIERDRATLQPIAAPRKSSVRETRQPMSSIRKRIAERLVASRQSTATLTTFNEADLSEIINLRNRYKDRFKERHGIGLGFMGFFVKASIEALRAYPNVNARIEGDEVVLPHYYHIGVAVSTERGLMVPVIRDADQCSLADIEKHLAAIAQKARDGKIAVDDLQGGTFTITNGGVFGSLLSTPILNPPQSAILGMHAIQKRPVAVEDQVVIRPMMYLALSYDHRLIDGREAVLCLVRIKECIEDPERLLLEV